MQLYSRAVSLTCAFFQAQQQLARDSHSPKGRKHFDGPNVCRRRIVFTAKACNGKSSANVVHNPHPRAAIRILGQRSHQVAAEAQRRRKANLFNGKQRPQIGTLKRPGRHLIRWASHGHQSCCRCRGENEPQSTAVIVPDFASSTARATTGICLRRTGQWIVESTITANGRPEIVCWFCRFLSPVMKVSKPSAASNLRSLPFFTPPQPSPATVLT